jgi:hypothetical protein
MSSEHSQSEEHQQRYKTISSEDDTRHPTTNKKNKVNHSEFTRNNPYLLPTQKINKLRKQEN